MEAYIDGIYQAEFSKAIAVVVRRQEIIVFHIENSKNVMKEASPGPLKIGPKWKDWIP